MLLGFSSPHDDVIHGTEFLGREEYLAALRAHFGRDVPQNVEVSLPTVNVFNAPYGNGAFAEGAFFHFNSHSCSRSPIIP